MLLLCSSAQAHTWPKHCRDARAPLLCKIHKNRNKANHLRRRMGDRPIPYRWVAEAHPERRPRLLRYWIMVRQDTLRRWTLYQASPTSAIIAAFGGAANEALTVARCESGLSVHATNGQYYGLFQLSTYIRYSRSGIPHAGSSTSADLQARAAAAVYRQDGGSWREWSCQP